MGILGIILGIVLVVVLTYRGLSVLIAAPLSAFVVMLFNSMPLIDAMSGNFFQGTSVFVKNMLGIYLTGMILGELYTKTGAAKSIAIGIASFAKGKDSTKKVSPAVTIFIIFIIGLLLGYAGLNVVALVFVLMPLAIALMKEANIPLKMAPGIVIGCTCTAALCAPGSPQAFNAISMTFLKTSPMAAAVPGFIGAAVVVVLNIAYLTYSAKKETSGLAVDEQNIAVQQTAAASEVLSAENLPNPLVSLVPLVIIFLLFNIARLYIVYSIAIGILVGMVLLYKYYGGYKQISPLVSSGATSACVVLLLGAAMSGFGSVVSASPGFTPIAQAVGSFNGPPLLVVLVSTMAITGVCGSGPAGLGVEYPMFSQTFFDMGVSPAAFHRIACFAGTTFDTLPTNGLFLAATGITGLAIKQTYKYVGVCSVLNTAIGAIVVTIICSLFPGLALS